MSYSAPYAGYGDCIDTLPSAFEREVHVMTNAVRMDPLGFRDKYIAGTTILQSAHYPAVAPLCYNHNLSRAARFHSVEMAQTCGMVHNSCDGTTFSSRLNRFYGNGFISENIATGKATGLQTVIQWLRDDLPLNGPPAADSTAFDGHRRNIMSSNYKEIGVGYVYNKSREWYHFWTEDFGGGSVTMQKIPAGCHFLQDNSTVAFAANYYDSSGAAPKSARVVIDNQEHAMSVHLGSAAKGTYIYTMSNDNKLHCYYFLFTDGFGVQIRFPQTTTLTTGSGLYCDIKIAVRDTDSHKIRPTDYQKKNAAQKRVYSLDGTSISGKLLMYRSSGIYAGRDGTVSSVLSLHRPLSHQ